MTLFFLLWIFISKNKMTSIILTEKQLELLTKHLNKGHIKEENISKIEKKDYGLNYMTEIFGGKIKINIKS